METLSPGESALKRTLPSDREIRFTRSFAAPRSLVFNAITKPEMLKQWLHGPSGWTLAICEVELRVGGSYRYVWRKDDGTEMGMGGVFREITPPERLVATEQFDEPWYPGEAQVTQELTEENGATRLAITIRYESAEGREIALNVPMESGMAASYDRLDQVLATSTGAAQ